MRRELASVQLGGRNLRMQLHGKWIADDGISLFHVRVIITFLAEPEKERKATGKGGRHKRLHPRALVKSHLRPI